MSSKAKGKWGHNPTMRSQHQPKPKYARQPPEVSDGCLGNIAIILLFSILTLCFCKAKKGILETGYPERSSIIAEDVVMVIAEDIIL